MGYRKTLLKFKFTNYYSNDNQIQITGNLERLKRRKLPAAGGNKSHVKHEYFGIPNYNKITNI